MTSSISFRNCIHGFMCIYFVIDTTVYVTVFEVG